MNPPLFGIAGRSGQGKTTLIEALLPWFSARGLTVNVIKHSHHSIELEPPGKDSARFRRAGTREVLIGSPYRYAIVRELHGNDEPPLSELVARLPHVDFVIVEGFAREAMPRLEVVRPSTGASPLYKNDIPMLAIATDDAAVLGTSLTTLAFDDIEGIGEFICKMLRIS
ncbi:Molybdopterin-guanine dinucleotide biosynthesis protein MobB [Candidatus Burkholderia pumila]|uniref:Molybdopterin-guanine dinucleotide biosynthesis protein MobB n=1 Tax=Candidatus Burkholderia pumila TaxID=1090375 RepID=A0ABR5HM22_9BURK|nr:Molybdopterin-guanine dinucleotide biosynthesis protein MobB [Candidatus Burkholderia pumila]